MAAFSVVVSDPWYNHSRSSEIFSSCVVRCESLPVRRSSLDSHAHQRILGKAKRTLDNEVRNLNFIIEQLRLSDVRLRRCEGKLNSLKTLSRHAKDSRRKETEIGDGRSTTPSSIGLLSSNDGTITAELPSLEGVQRVRCYAWVVLFDLRV